MKDRIFTTKEQGRLLLEAGLPLSTAVGYRPRAMDRMSCMEDDESPVSLIEAVTPDVRYPVWDVATLMNLLPEEIDGSPLAIRKIAKRWFVDYTRDNNMHEYMVIDDNLIDAMSLMTIKLLQDNHIILKV